MVLFILAARSPACMWDTDTLAEEASLGKDFIATISGRFPRNPPLYYAMRRDRLLAKKSKTVGEYDDLAVAYERLGDSLSALRWIDRKPSGTREDEYRTQANRGTFLVHAWLRGKLDIRAGRRGLIELERAVRINPNAHFGRERVQIRLVKQFLDPTGSFPPDEDALRGAEGFAGIVRLGSGWESSDVFRAMAIDLADYRGSKPRLGAVASLALLRADELMKMGHKARLDDGTQFKMVTGAQMPSLERRTREEFTRLRREADEWQTRRGEFMLARLQTGRHPDTDPTYWRGWEDGEAPQVRDGWIERTFGSSVPWYFVVLGGLVVACVVLAPLFGAYMIGRALWRRSARARSS